MKKLNGYEAAKAYTERERLPVGGYVLKIMDVKYHEYTYGDVILLSFDIEEGELKGFFMNDWKNQSGEDKKWRGTYRLNVPKDDGSKDDEWRMRRFKTVISNFEESNPGYHWNWDEQTLKGKKIGALFNDKEYEINGRNGFYTNCHSLVTVEKIREGKFTVPEPTMLKKNNGPVSSGVSDMIGTDEFMNIPDGIDEELPFN